MQRRVGDITIESTSAESAKFAAPLVLVHGLWCSAAVWRQFMGYLAHRGWTCHALNLRGHGDAGGRDQMAGVCIADYASDLQRVIALCDAPPVVIGHDLGGLLALACSPTMACAVVALAPLVPRAIGGVTPPVLTGWRTRLALWRSRPLPPPRGRFEADYFAPVLPGGVTADSAIVVREASEGTFDLPASSGRPALLVAGERDTFCPPRVVEQLARRVGAQFQTAERAGHAMPWEPGWERLVATTHRWIVQALGESLLLLRDEEE